MSGKSVVSSSAPGASPSGSTAGSQSSLRTITLILLPVLSLTGAFGTWFLSDRNGTFAMIGEILTQETVYFPGTNDLLVKSYTGIEFIDAQLVVLITFFAPFLDVKNVESTLFSLFGFGQFGAAWTLLMMESLRSGNEGKLVSFIGIVGLIFQCISFTVTIPLYLFVHLLTSPVARAFTGAHANSVIPVSSLDLKILPLSTIVGYIIPSILMALQSPSVVSPDAHQLYIAIWQAFPLWAVLIQSSITFLCRIFTDQASKSDSRQSVSSGIPYLNNVKHVYRFVIAFSIITHIPVIAITLLPPEIFPDWASDLIQLSHISFYEVYVPYFPVLSHQVSSLAEGVHNFLLWDLYVGSASVLVWAILLYRNAASEKPQDGAFWKIAWKVTTWTLVSGPMGASAILLWERDAILGQKVKRGV